jgi:hypothetical protein
VSKRSDQRQAARQRPGTGSPEPAKTGQNRPSKSPAVDEDAASPDIDGLTVRQARALAALLAEPTLARAAHVAEVGERTLRRWKQEPIFSAALLAARHESYSQAVNLITRYAPAAAAALVKITQDASTSAASRVSAAGMLLKLAREAIELEDIVARVEALEQQQKVVPTPPKPVEQPEDPS